MGLKDKAFNFGKSKILGKLISLKIKLITIGIAIGVILFVILIVLFCNFLDIIDTDTVIKGPSLGLSSKKVYAAEEKPSGGDFNGDKVTAAGYTFPHYIQYKEPYASRNYGPNWTISDSGCGPTSMAMILAGLKGDTSITPITFIENLEKYYPDYSNYVCDDGSYMDALCDNGFLGQYYNCSSRKIQSDDEAYAALEAGKPICGYESGHILAIIPAPDEYKSQGYKFYIMDSARGHDGPYRSAEEAAGVAAGFGFNHIIEPM